MGLETVTCDHTAAVSYRKYNWLKGDLCSEVITHEE